MHRRTTAPRRAREAGMVIWTVLLLVVAMGGLSVGMLWNGMGEQTAVEHRRTSLMALQIGEMGTLQAQMEILAQKDLGDDGIGVVTGHYNGGSYLTRATQNPSYPDRWVVHAEATYRNSVKRLETGLRRRRHSDFVEGLFAKDKLTANGDLSTDAYDSRLGTYASQAIHNDSGGPYAEGGGHLGSNLDIALNGTAATIRGNAIPGLGHEVLTSGSPTVWGDVMPRRRTVPIADVSIEEFQAALASNDNKNLVESTSGGGGKPVLDNRTLALSAGGSKRVELPGGTYFFSAVSFTGGAQLVVSGPSVIYVTGGFDVSGGALLNTTGVPSNLVVYAHPYDLGVGGPRAVSRVEFGGGSQTSLAVYAPGVDVRIHGDSNVFGAIVGKQITVLGDADFHYDKALGAWEKHSVTMIERLYWKDLGETLR